MDSLQPPRTRSLSCSYSSSASNPSSELTHLTPAGTVHMVPIGQKQVTERIAEAIGFVYFSNPEPLRLIRANALKKGDVLAVSRIAGIMAAKRTPDLIPLCHPIALTSVHVDVDVRAPAVLPSDFGSVLIRAQVKCEGKTGVEMEALTAVSAAALSIFDMCKAVDRGMSIKSIRVVLKAGGRSGTWRDESEPESDQTAF